MAIDLIEFSTGRVFLVWLKLEAYRVFNKNSNETDDQMYKVRSFCLLNRRIKVVTQRSEQIEIR